MMTSVRKMLQTLVRSAQNRLISSEICVFTDCFLVKFAPENSRENSRFFREFVPKNPTKFDFFFRNLSEALFCGATSLLVFDKSCTNLASFLFLTLWVPMVTNVNFLLTISIHCQEMVMRINKMIIKEKVPWSFMKFSQHIL